MRYFKLENSASETLDITTQEVFFNEIEGLGFEEDNSFVSIGPVWRLQQRTVRQKPVTGKITFTAIGGTTPYEKYEAFFRFIAKSPLYLLYYPHGLSGTEYKKRVRVSVLEKSELTLYGSLDCHVEFSPYTPWYTVSSYENIVPDDSEDDYTGWFWDIGNKWRDTDSGGGDPIGTVYYPFSQMPETQPSSVDPDGISIVHPEGDTTTFKISNTVSNIADFGKSFTIPPGCYRMELLTDFGTNSNPPAFSITVLRNGIFYPVRQGADMFLQPFKAGAQEEDIWIDSECLFRIQLPRNLEYDFTVQLKMTKLASAPRYKFAYESHSALTFNVDSDVKGLAKLTIKGPATNPQWTHYVNGKIVSSGGISLDSILALGDDDILVVDNTKGEYTIDLVKGNGNAVSVYSLRDFDRKCFITLEPGENTITVSSDKGEPLSFEIEGWVFYDTV